MLNKISKYFSVFLILFLVNSNYSFALTHMMCKMNKTQEVCECDQKSTSGELQIDSMDPGCCRQEIKEINNTNTLESNRISLVSEAPFISINFFEESKIHSFTSFISHIESAYFHPPVDIPILYSQILI